MTELEKLINRAFENKANKNHYQSGIWSVAFETRTWETLFWIYKDNITMLEGNTLDKEVGFCRNDEDNPKLLAAIRKVLLEYSVTNLEYVRSVPKRTSKLSHIRSLRNPSEKSKESQSVKKGQERE